MASAMTGNPWPNKEEKAWNPASKKFLLQEMNIPTPGLNLSIKDRNPNPRSAALSLLSLRALIFAQRMYFCFHKLSRLCYVSVLELLPVMRPRTFGDFFGMGWVKASGPGISLVHPATVSVTSPLFIGGKHSSWKYYIQNSRSTLSFNSLSRRALHFGTCWPLMYSS